MTNSLCDLALANSDFGKSAFPKGTRFIERRALDEAETASTFVATLSFETVEAYIGLNNY